MNQNLGEHECCFFSTGQKHSHNSNLKDWWLLHNWLGSQKLFILPRHIIISTDLIEKDWQKWIVGYFFGDNQLASAWGRWSSVTWVLSEGLDGGRRVDTCGHNLSPDSRNGYNLGAGNYRRNIGGDIGANCAPRDGSWPRESIVTAGRTRELTPSPDPPRST